MALTIKIKNSPFIRMGTIHMLTQKAKNAIRALIILARSDGQSVSSREIAKLCNVSAKFMDLTLQEMRTGGFIKSIRGINGGYTLAKPKEQIVMGDLVRHIDGPLAPIACASITAYEPCTDCYDTVTCSIRALMFEVRNAICSVLDHRCLADLLETPEIIELSFAS